MGEDFLEELASGEPTPGGGAASAVLVAMAAALVAMVCRLTVGRPRYRDHEDVLGAVLGEADQARSQAVALAQADSDAYRGVIDALALPREDEDQRRERTARVQVCLREATEVPLATLDVAGQVASLLERATGRVNPHAASDLAVAAHTVRAALDAATLNVETNLARITDEGYAGVARTRAEEVAAAARGALARVADAPTSA